MNSTFIQIGKRTIRLESVAYTEYDELEKKRDKSYAILKIYFIGGEHITLYDAQAEQMNFLFESQGLNITPG